MGDVPPIALSAIICDCVILDAYTKSLTIRNIVHTIAAYDYPTTHPRLTFFFELTNGHGEVEIVVKLIEVNEDATKDDVLLLEIDPPIKITFADVRQVIAQEVIKMKRRKYIETRLSNGKELGMAKLKLHKRGKVQAVCNTTSLPEPGFDEVKKLLSNKPIRAYRPIQLDNLKRGDKKGK